MAALGEQLEALGPECTDIARVEHSGELAWIVAFDDDTAVAIEPAPRGRLALGAPVGQPPVDRRFVVYESLLAFSSLWRDNHGCRLALGGDSELQVGLEIPAGLTAGELCTAVREFAALARLWREYVAAPAAAVTLPPLMPSIMAMLA